jgi:hypothetical protein
MDGEICPWERVFMGTNEEEHDESKLVRQRSAATCC